VRLGVMGLLAVTTFVLSNSWLSTARDGARTFGQGVTVLIARRDLPSGTEVGAGDVELRTLPSSAVPIDVVDEFPPQGTRVTNQLGAGQVLTRGDIEQGRSALSLLVGADQVAISLPRRGDSIPLEPHDRIEIVGATSDSPARTLGVATVIDATDEYATITGDVDSIEAVASALVADSRGDNLIVVLLPGSS